ncbi:MULTISPECIES: M1 family metallopeptidase [Roseivirga]|uniref:Aminopeptidase n=1 Tax=Roseivirga thermotolerans TaxID=1758176 RepID=A0ABQ3I6R4_9BACT|nr:MULTISPECIES: M1 family metallopeptidase [Roseivirga]MEC7755208.1 M1 family metallopeptidase [Bacteroidota bacterium]GHE55507.1 aminopeptidase [Roseivirga thermotolerans]|tara:strand:- start:1991 stop:4327 length:2337 start_codon:yes stop_codon:yes gene_type:complete
MKRIIYSLVAFCILGGSAFAQIVNSNHGKRFEQLERMLRDPSMYRSASGAPGPKYWQQRADYKIEATLNDENQRLDGYETITYFNNSPDPLTYLWLALDENVRHPDNDSYKFDESSIRPRMTYDQIDALDGHDNDWGFHITEVTDAKGSQLPYTINQTMMRIDLPQVLKPGEKISFNIRWWYNTTPRNESGARGGHEYFPEDGNYIYTITGWFPRMAVYSDFQGWNNKQFTGRGEFALTFGNYDVKMTVPSDHIVGSTGWLQNPKEVLNAEQQKRWAQAQKTFDEPVKIVTLEEAKANEKEKASGTKTWHYKAENVRDFAWTSSRKFVWDAMAVDIEGSEKHPMAMSYYAKEAYGIYERYSTKVVAHTLKTYSKYTIPYPYPVAISVEASNGMEYPMICFNYGRTLPDGTYSESTKWGAIGVIIHEVGHNFFPMIVNSDERQWTWMDEGLNTFVQYLTEQEFDNNYPHRRGPAYKIAPYMALPKDQLEPIMTNSENIIGFGNNAYAKAATGLNILRETIMGRELFDFAFKQYAQRWAFKHPTPDDLFRTLEDASAVDIDWFIRGWYFTIDHVDIAIENVRWYKLDTKNPEIEYPIAAAEDALENTDIADSRNREEGMKFLVEEDPKLQDFYHTYDEFEVTEEAKRAYQRFTASLSAEERALLGDNKNFYEIEFTNKGGLVMPLIIEWTYVDGTKEVERIPAYIWRKNEEHITKAFMKDKEVVQIRLDPYRETADTDEDNNYFPRVSKPSRFELFRWGGGGARGQSTGSNPMQRANGGN